MSNRWRRFEALLAAGRIVDREIKLVQLQPHLRRDDFANGARIFPSRSNAGKNRIRVLRIETQKLNHVLLRRFAVAFLEISVVAGRIDQRLPLLVFAGRRIEHQLQIHIDEPSHVLGSLHIAGQPVNRFGDAAEHIQTPA